MNEMIWEDVHEDQLSEYPFRFLAEVQSLQQMASYRICQAMWHAYISSHNVDIMDMVYHDEKEYHRDDQLQEKVKTLVEDLKLHRPVEEMLKRDVIKTYNELVFWAACFNTDFLTEDVKLKLKLEVEVEQLWFGGSYCDWLPNGEIDYLRSATKTLISARLNDRQKFFVMSIFCMEDEIETISQDTIQYFASWMNFDIDSSLLFYWLCYLQNELERVPIDNASTLEKTMFLRCWFSRHMIGLEYFWYRLTNDDRISLAEDIFHDEVFVRRIVFHFLERLYSSISSSSTRSLAVVSAGYLKISLKKSSSLRYPFLVWHRFKHQITSHEFANMFANVFDNVIVIHDRMQLLVHVWDTAYDHQREYVAEHKSKDIILGFSHYFETKAPCSSLCDVICRILLQNSEHRRLELLLEEVGFFASQINIFRALKKVLDVCLLDSNYRSRFNYELSRSKYLQTSCERLLEDGKYAELDREVAWIFSSRGPNAFNEYKKLILAPMTWGHTHTVKTFFSSIDKWNGLNEFIDKTYAEDHQSAVELKRMLAEAATQIIRNERDFHKSFDVLRQIIEMIIPAQDLVRFKYDHLYGFGQQIRSKTYWNDEQDGDQIFLQNFVEWCCDGDIESISKFKKSVPRGAMLYALVSKLKSYRIETQSEVEKLLHRLDWYLEWFVGSAQKVTECKLQAVEFSTIDVANFNSWTLLELNLPYRQILLGWLCGGDEEAVKRIMAQEVD